MVYKSSEVSRSEVKGFKLFGFDQGMPHVWWNSEITLREKQTMYGVVALIELGSQENCSWAPPIFLFNFYFSLFFPPPSQARGEPAFLN